MEKTITKQDQDILKELFFNREAKKARILSTAALKQQDLQDYDVIIHLGKKRENILTHATSYRYIMQNGTIRYLFPKGKLKTVLDFYPVSTFRARMIKRGIQLLATLGLERWVSSALTVYTQQPIQLAIEPERIPHEEFSVFFGTPGAERTVLVSLLNNSKCTSYLKFGLSSYSNWRVINEGQFLHRMEYTPLKHIKTPAHVPTSKSNVIGISKLTPTAQKTTTAFTHLHALAIEDLLNASPALHRFDQTQFGDIIYDNLSALRNASSPLAKRIYPFLKHNFQQVRSDYYFLSGITHGDFTPWNMFVDKTHLHLYDWESAQTNAPFLFDVFHYHFQTGIHLENWTFDQIYKRIEMALNLEPIASIIEQYSIDPHAYLRLYLLHTVSTKTLVALIDNKVASMKDLGEFSVWEAALKFTIPVTENQRASFIQEFNSHLQHLEHAFIKFDALSLDNLSENADLDIAISRGDVQKAVDFCLKHGFVLRSKVIAKSFMTVVQLFFKNGDFLSIDLIHEFKRKSLPYMDIRPLLFSARRNKFGVVVPETRFDLENVLLFYTLNNAPVPFKYEAFFRSQPTIDKTRALNYFEYKYNIKASTLTNLFDFIAENRSQFKKTVQSKNMNTFLGSIISKWTYIIDTLKDITLQKGFVITISGVDGVGKSSVIDSLKDKIKLKYRRDVVLLRHRPHLLPILSTFKYGSKRIAELKSSHTQPHTITTKSRISSGLRFTYYLADYLLGQGYVYLRYIIRGKIVLYDRYYFDMINHPERTNLSIHRGVAKWFYRYIKNPSLNILLHAPTDVIYERKQELEPFAIEQLNHKYLNLFDEFSKKYNDSFVVVENGTNIDQTISNILTNVQKVA